MADKSGQGADIRQRVIGYARVSTAGQGESGIGLESQKAAIEAFVEKMDWELIQMFEEVATAMGPGSAKDQAELQKALSVAKDNDALILAWDWSRISRDTASFDDIAGLLPHPDRIISVMQGTTFGDVAAAGQHAYAQKQGEAISKATKEGMAKKRDQGAVHGNPGILDVQPKATAAASAKANVLVRQIAGILIEHGSVLLSREKVAQILNGRGILSGQNKL